MKEITFIFNGLGYDNHYQAEVLIYDHSKLIYQGETYNGLIKVALKNNKKYKLIARFLNNYLPYCFYVDGDMVCRLSFKHSLIELPNRNIITFLLTDYHYDNLKIERGEIILWPKT